MRPSHSSANSLRSALWEAHLSTQTSQCANIPSSSSSGPWEARTHFFLEPTCTVSMDWPGGARRCPPTPTAAWVGQWALQNVPSAWPCPHQLENQPRGAAMTLGLSAAGDDVLLTCSSSCVPSMCPQCHPAQLDSSLKPCRCSAAKFPKLLSSQRCARTRALTMTSDT